MNTAIASLAFGTKENCPICMVGTRKLLTHQLRRGEGTVHYCMHCEHGFLTENTIGDVKSYYETEYRSEYSHKSKTAQTNAKEILEIYGQFQDQRLNSIVPELKESHRLLEIGAASGVFIKHIQNKVDCIHAIELDNECCNYLSQEFGVECDSNYLEDSKFFNQKYDIVCSFQVLEHVEDPVVFLANIKKVMAYGAKAYIEVPNLRDPLLSIWDIPSYKSFYYHKAHLHYFTEASLLKVAEMAGFSATNATVAFTQDYNLLNHLHWIMNDQPQNDCMVGLSPINLKGREHSISDWLTAEMHSLNKKYIERLVNLKCTSNLLLCLTND